MKKASSLKAAKELATGIESNRIPMDGGDTLDRYTRETLSQLSEELESAYLILNFAEGETEKYIEIIPKDNSDGDGDRLFMINLFAESENAEISPVSGITVTITDDEVQEPAEVEFSQSEYDPQDGYIKATLVRSGAVNQMVSVKMSTEDVTAAKERDYSPVDTTVAFPYGITERTVNIPVRSDYVDTQAEFRMLLSDAANCNIGAIDTASGVISSDSESFSQVQEADGDAASQEEDGSSSDVSLMADAGVDSVITGTQIDLTKAYSSGAHDDGYSRANGSEWELYAKSTWNDVSSWAYWSEGTHYDYSGLQIEWTKESGQPCYTSTYVRMYNLDSDSSDRWDTIWSTGEERWGKRTNNMYFSVDRFQEFNIRLTRDGGWTGKSPTLKIHSVKPILRPFEISLKGADPLYFLNEDGKYVKNTSISGMTTANQTTLQNATNTGTGTVVKFSGDTFTVTTNSDYAYISGLKIVDNDTGASKLIKKGLAVGTKTASVQLTNDFIKQNLDYITFTKNGSQGRKGAFSIQAVLDYYDTEVNIHSDYRGEIYHNLSPEEPAEEESSQISGYYYIKNKNSGLYLQSSKADAQGNVVQGKMTDSGSCVWYFQTDAKGWTTLENGSGYYLDANVNLLQLLFGAIKSSKTAGKSGGSAQNFKIIKQSDGSYIFRSGVSESRALSVLGAWEGAAASLITIGSQADASSSWMLEKADIVTEGTYRIKNLNSGLYLRPDGAGHYNVKQSSAQDYLNWTVIRQSDGWYTIKNESGYMLDVSGAYPDDGTRLITYASNESDAQKFMLKKQEDKMMRHVTVLS